jgi:ATP-dependent Clp protease adaptor protein ClpS
MATAYTFKLARRLNFTKGLGAGIREAFQLRLAASKTPAAPSDAAAARKPSPNSRFHGRPGVGIFWQTPATTSGGAAAMIEAVTKPKTRAKPKTERPRLHKVILVNDDFTPRGFVVTVLKTEFHMTEDQAYKVMFTAHRRGVCVVAVFTKDVAETKATRATDAGRAKGYPLLFTTEPEE